MSDSSAPRRIERLLGALGADTEFSEGVIGDLAEEYAIREQWDGAAAARRWYYREALRVTPHLLGAWRRELRWRDVGALANNAALASICALTLSYFLVLSVGSIGSAFGLRVDATTSWPVLAVGAVVWNFGIGSFAGYVAAWLHRRAPMPAALSVAGFWFVLMTVLNMVAGGGPVPAWVRVASVSALIGGMTLGGILRVTQMRGETKADPSLRSG